MEKIDHGLYDLRDQFDAWEAACLIAGFEPTSIDRGDRLCIPTRVKVLLSLIEDAYQEALLYWRTVCSIGVHVYGTNGVPTELAVSADPSVLPSAELWAVYTDAIEGGLGPDAYAHKRLSTKEPKFWREDLTKWLTLIGWKGARYFATQEEPQARALTSRERETLLKLVIGMAIGGYGHDVTAKKTDTVSQIIKDMETYGLAISDETVRKYLKEAKALLPGKAT